MNIAAFSIKRPIFITAIVSVSLILGVFAMTRMGVDLFPKVEIPVVVVTVPYPGALPEEIETLISRPLEEEFSSISGLDEIYSFSRESISVVICKFKLESDIKDAEQQVRNKISAIRRTLPSDIEEPNIERIDFDSEATVRLALSAELPESKLYELAEKEIKPTLQQANNVGSVRIFGGRKREIQIELDRNLLNSNELSAMGIAGQLRNYGVNTPIGKYDQGTNETSFRTIGRFTSLQEIRDVVVSFGGDFSNFVPLSRVGKISDGLEDAESLATLYAPVDKKDFNFKNPTFYETVFNLRVDEIPQIKRERKSALFLDVIKQSGSNTIRVADDILKRVDSLNKHMEQFEGKPQLIVINDQSHYIKANVEDVVISIVVGILLAIVVVYFFLGNIRSTIITGLALPNSLLGAFIIMYAVGFTANVMSLLALSLAVGLLIDDAIVVRENIFKRMEEGEHPVHAAETGTMQVIMAVFATSLVIMAVFVPIGFLKGMIGQFFKEFAFTVVFALIISTFDAVTMAPMLSAYFAGDMHKKPNFLIRGFNALQDQVDRLYARTLHFSIAHPLIIILLTGVILGGSFVALKFIKFTFMPTADRSDFNISLTMPPGTSLDGTNDVAEKIENYLHTIPEVHYVASVVGSTRGTANPVKANLTVGLLPYHKRSRDSMDIKDEIQKVLKKDYSKYKLSVSDGDMISGGGQSPFTLYITGHDLEKVQKYVDELVPRLQKISDLANVRSDNEGGKPEFQIVLEPKKLQQVAVAPATAGQELRLHIAGGVVAKLYEGGEEYKVRMRLKPEQRNLEEAFRSTHVPNIHGRLIPVSAVSESAVKFGPSVIRRQNRARAVPIIANLSKGGAIGKATDEAEQIIATELPPPEGVYYAFHGESQDLKELMNNIVVALVLALLFIYLALASLYESFITPFTILLALPPAVSGAFYALALTGQTLNIFSMIGIIMLLGLVAKNSILLVDFAMQEIRDHGKTRSEAIYNAGVARLRPILMTSVAMIGGMLPVSIGIGEAAKSRVSLGIAIIGGLILSTLISLVVVPSVFSAIDRFRVWAEGFFTPDYDFKQVGKAWRPEEEIWQEKLPQLKDEIKSEVKEEMQEELRTQKKSLDITERKPARAKKPKN